MAAFPRLVLTTTTFTYGGSVPGPPVGSGPPSVETVRRGQVIDCAVGSALETAIGSANLSAVLTGAALVNAQICADGLAVSN